MSADIDHEEWMSRYLAGMAEHARSELAKAAGAIARFTELAARRGTVLKAEAFEYVQTIGVIARAPGLAKALIQPVEFDRDGLYSYADVSQLLPPSRFQAGYFAGPDYMLMAHPFYRRGMHPLNNWAPLFVDLFWGLELPDVKKYIAIDEDRVRIDVDGPSYVEADTWYGAPFNEDVRNIKAGTAKLRPPLDLDPKYIDFLFARAYSLDVKWSKDNSIKTFQALEMKTEDVRVNVDGESYHPARYMHAEFDVVANRFRHFDGAIQLYLPDEYLHRRDADFNMSAKNLDHIKARSKKVFKLNGPISTETWVELCCHFCAGNPLTIEYFAGAYPRHVTDALERIRVIKKAPDAG